MNITPKTVNDKIPIGVQYKTARRKDFGSCDIYIYIFLAYLRCISSLHNLVNAAFQNIIYFKGVYCVTNVGL